MGVSRFLLRKGTCQKQGLSPEIGGVVMQVRVFHFNFNHGLSTMF